MTAHTRTSGHSGEPERMLLQAVINQSMRDARAATPEIRPYKTGMSKAEESETERAINARKNKRDALAWIRDDDNDKPEWDPRFTFNEVCHVLGHDPDIYRDSVREL